MTLASTLAESLTAPPGPLAAAGTGAATWLALPLVGLAGGMLGGMFGVGGGLVMIPAMLLLLGRDYGSDALHLFKLASLVSSVVVSIPAAVRQGRAGMIVPPILVAMIPLGIAGVIVGVGLASLFQREQTHVLARIFGAFMIAVALAGLRMPAGTADAAGSVRSSPSVRRRMTFGLMVGLPSGLIAGLLGVAGGVWAVPALNAGLGVRLRYAIANSTGLIVVLAAAAAAAQSIAVARMPALAVGEGWRLAFWLAPGALVGGWLGASLSLATPVRRLRAAFYALVAVMGARLVWTG